MINLKTDMTIDEATALSIISRISEETKIDVSVITGKTKPKAVAIVRQTAIYIIRINNTEMTLKGIGKLFGDKDHSTIKHSIKIVTDEYLMNKKFKENLRRICSDINPELLKDLDRIEGKEEEDRKRRKWLSIESNQKFVSLSK